METSTQSVGIMKGKEAHTKTSNKISQNIGSTIGTGLVHLGIIVLLVIYVEIKTHKQDGKIQKQETQIATLSQKVDKLQDELNQSRKEWKTAAGDDIASKLVFWREQGILGKCLL